MNIWFFPVFSMIVIGLMNWLASLISWLICIFVGLSSIAITGILWWTYYDIRHTDESKVKWSILEEFVRNESAVYVLAIIASIVMVISISHQSIEPITKVLLFAGLHSCNHFLPSLETQRLSCTVWRGQQMYVLASRSDGSAHFGDYRISALPDILVGRRSLFGNGEIPRHGTIDQAITRQLEWTASIGTYSDHYSQQ